MIFDILRIIFGILFVMFMPGYLLTFLLFKKLGVIERISLAIGLSISIVVFLGFFLTAVGYIAGIKGITAYSIWFSLLTISLIFLILIIIKAKWTR